MGTCVISWHAPRWRIRQADTGSPVRPKPAHVLDSIAGRGEGYIMRQILVECVLPLALRSAGGWTTRHWVRR